ncbi:MAG TPA: YidC/Oxa1 family membrane protein insertase [Solirubrobacteraceae bacterium]|nr:YidC/Oxa1 family membrane protein insertase [Solirubrobacteraceae bacterium]
MLPLANILQPLIDVFESVLLFFHDNVGLGWGTSIIALTVVVRAALVPLTLKQIRSMQAMQRLAPEIKALQEKYKDDKQRLQQETMKFYQERKVNPFASCLPLLLQMPVFIALFYMLQDDLRYDICPNTNPPSVTDPRPCGSTAASQFFFIPDITDKATGGVLLALVVMYVGSQLLSSVFMSTTVDRNQRLIMMGLPFFFVPFIINFPAGLLVYWITTNLWTVGQGVIVRKLAPPPEPATVGVPAGARAAAPEPRRRRPGDQESDGASAERPARRAAAPPPPPRKKKKRSGRRR